MNASGHNIVESRNLRRDKETRIDECLSSDVKMRNADGDATCA